MGIMQTPGQQYVMHQPAQQYVIQQQSQSQTYTMEQYQALLQQRAMQQQGQQYVSYQSGASPLQYAVQTRQASVTLPADSVPGMVCKAQMPDGQEVEFEVPQGHGPGMTVNLSY